MKTNIQKLILALMWLALPLLAQAQFGYSDNGDGTATITNYTGSGGAVAIPATMNSLQVTGVGYQAFYDCLTLTSVTIPNSVTSIGINAFVNCHNMTSATLGKGVINIGIAAFIDCYSLTNVTISDSVTSIGNNAFGGCNSLTSVTIGSGVTNIGQSVFSGCTSLTSVTIPNSVTNIGSNAFGQCSGLTNIALGNGVTSIGQYAFYDCSSLTSMTIPKSITSIGQNAFYNCSRLIAAYFLGNAPPDDGSAFTGFYANNPTTVYYLAGTTGWGSTFGGVPAVLWNPQAVTPGFTGGQFGFNLTGPTNAVIVIEACTNLSNPVWLPVATNTFSASGTSTFTDPSNYPSRFYRFRSP
jgi:hypothetical protein